MNPVAGLQQNLSGFNFPGGDDLARSFQSTSQAVQYAQVSAASSLQKDISLVTDDGDTVTISYQKNTAFMAEKYDAFYQEYSAMQGERGILLEQEQAELHGELFAYSQQEQFTLTISGDLDEDEERDIQEALKRIDKLMTETLSGGDLLAGAEEAEGIIGLENIARVDADYRYESLITIAAVSQASSVGTYRENGTLDDSLSGFAGLKPAADSPMADLQELIDKMSEVVEEMAAEKQIDPQQFIQPVEELFARYLDQLGDDDRNSKKPHVAQDALDLFRTLEKGLLKNIEEMQPV